MPDKYENKENCGTNSPSVSDRIAPDKKIDPKRLLRRLTLTAVCIAFAVVLKCFTNLALNIPGLGIKIGLGGIFNFFPAALCGPLWGGAASALTDLIGHFIAPDGAYIPWLTLTAFAGGCIVGILWRMVGKRSSNVLQVALISVFSVILFFGVGSAQSLRSDGICSGFIANAADLPGRSEINETSLSSMSRFVVGLSRYSKNDLTLTYLPNAAVISLPEKVSVNGEARNVTSIAAGALENAGSTVYIPASYKKIDQNAAGNRKDITIAGKAGSQAEKFARSAGLAFVESEAPDGVAFSVHGVSDGDALDLSGFGFTQSDGFRKNLASNINLVVLGSILAGACGIIFIVLNMIVTSIADKRGKTGGERAFSFLKIALCVTVSGLFVTTVNTFILRAFVPAWADRALIVLWVPRVVEEIVIRLGQAYIISLLWGAIDRGRAGDMLKKL